MASQSIKVLLIEDDSGDVELIRHYLAEDHEARVGLHNARRMTDGLAYLQENEVDLVLLDLMLPDTVGLDTFRQLHGQHPGVPVVVMTGVKADEVAIQAVREGAEDYLFKSELNGTQLHQTVRYAVERVQSRQMEQAYLATQRELAIAREIQQGLYPDAAPQIPDYDIAGASFPALAVGGDYFDFLALGDDHLGIAIGDASGHGLGPALVSAETRATLRSLAISHHSAAEIVTLANRLLSLDMPDTHFITLFLALLNPRTGSLAYTSAGHEPGFILDVAGRLKAKLDSTGIPLGIMAEYEFPHSVGLTLEPGDLVVLLTDGVREAHSAEPILLGFERVLQVVQTHRQEPAARIIDAMVQAVRGHCRPHLPPDDYTVIVIKVSPEARLSPFPTE